VCRREECRYSRDSLQAESCLSRDILPSVATMTNPSFHPLRQYRERTGASLAAIAARVGVTRQTLSKIELEVHSPGPSLARKLEEATGVPKHELRPDLWDAPKGARRARSS
jgi:DNA-binding XRE family transcriptional regulator